VIIAGMRPVSHAAVFPYRRARAPVSCPARTLLPPGLLAAARDLGTRLYGMRALPDVGKMRHYDLMHGRNVNRRAEHLFGQSQLF